jgi:hypothetical protein
MARFRATPILGALLTSKEAKMSDPKSACVNRRTIFIAAASATPLLALMSGNAEAKMTQAAVRYQDSPKDGPQCVDGAISPKGE